MKKVEVVSIQGSKYLLAAFEQELQSVGYVLDGQLVYNWTKSSNASLEWQIIVNEGRDKKYAYHNHRASATSIFSLPLQWDEAVQAIKDILVEDKIVYKEGDIVYVVSNIDGGGKGTHGCNSKAEYPIGLITKVSRNEGESGIYTGQDWIHCEGKRNAITSNQLRMATEEEILQYWVTKSGLKIGSAINGNKVNSWTKEGFNYYSEKTWRHSGSNFIGNRIILDLKIVGGKAAFLISGTSVPIWINIEGYAEFQFKEQKELEIAGYKEESHGTYVAFGCQEFNKAELQAYRRLLNNPVNGKIEIQGTQITNEIIDKLISKLK